LYSLREGAIRPNRFERGLTAWK